MIICGIHGTSRPCAEKIKTQGFKPGYSGQLGAACYFFPCFPNGYNRAIRWASSPHGRKLASLPGEAVALTAKINVISGLLNLASDSLRTHIQNAWYTIKSAHGGDDLLCDKLMRAFLADLCKEEAAKSSLDINNCVILAPYPPFDGGSFSRDSICYAVKGRGANISLCSGRRDNVHGL